MGIKNLFSLSQEEKKNISGAHVRSLPFIIGLIVLLLAIYGIYTFVTQISALIDSPLSLNSRNTVAPTPQVITPRPSPANGNTFCQSVTITDSERESIILEDAASDEFLVYNNGVYYFPAETPNLLLRYDIASGGITPVSFIPIPEGRPGTTEFRFSLSLIQGFISVLAAQPSYMGAPATGVLYRVEDSVSPNQFPVTIAENIPVERIVTINERIYGLNTSGDSCFSENEFYDIADGRAYRFLTETYNCGTADMVIDTSDDTWITAGASPSGFTDASGDTELMTVNRGVYSYETVFPYRKSTIIHPSDLPDGINLYAGVDRTSGKVYLISVDLPEDGKEGESLTHTVHVYTREGIPLDEGFTFAAPVSADSTNYNYRIRQDQTTCLVTGENEYVRVNLHDGTIDRYTVEGRSAHNACEQYSRRTIDMGAAYKADGSINPALLQIPSEIEIRCSGNTR